MKGTLAERRPFIVAVFRRHECSTRFSKEFLMARTVPRIGLMLGDPSGIGPELAAKLLADPRNWEGSTPLVIGDRRVLDQGFSQAKIAVPSIVGVQDADDAGSSGVYMLDRRSPDTALPPVGRVTPESGRMTLDTLLFSLELIRRGLLDALMFVPLNKEALMRAGMDAHSELELFKTEFPGHSGLEEINILDGAWALRVTSHIPLKDVAASLSVEKVLASLRFLSSAMKANGTKTARIAVAALNPHGGENGLCGREELDIIAPAVRLAAAEGIEAEGPFPADTVFLKVRSGEYQGILNMYHDQGQIATKLIGLSRGVTYHAGFPVPIATPAHGTAFDIAGKGIADVGPTRTAYEVVRKIANENLRKER